MKEPLESLGHDLDAVRTAWAGALPAFAGAFTASADAAQQLERMSDAGLMRTAETLGRLVRDGEAALARVAGEVARRSPAELGKDGLAKKQGFANPSKLIATATGGAVAGAAKLVFVGQATAPRQSLTGQRMPAAHPHVAAALQAGAISVDAAAAITSMLQRVARRADPAQAEQMEKILAERAADLPFELLLRLIRQAEARLDQDGLAPREEELREERSLHLREDRHGMVHLTAILDAETAAPVKAAIESIVTATIRSRRLECADAHPADGTGTGEPVVEDDRTIPQLQADALAMIARHVLGCSRMPSAPAMAVIVRTNLQTLTTGIGQAQIDGLDQPVSAGTVRKMAATAGLIPAIFDGDSLPLDLGHDARLFSWGNGWRSANATAVAPAAASTSDTSRLTTSTGGNATPDPPTSPTEYSSAHRATPEYTRTAGSSASPRDRYGSAHHPTSTPTKHPDSAAKPATRCHHCRTSPNLHCHGRSGGRAARDERVEAPREVSMSSLVLATRH